MHCIEESFLLALAADSLTWPVKAIVSSKVTPIIFLVGAIKA